MPNCSIILPTLNRPSSLTTAFEHLLRLETSHTTHEVLLVDDGSTTDPALALKEYESRLPFRILYQQRMGPAAARNLGARHARGNLLLFMDDDCRPDSGWLKAFLAAHRASSRALLGGTTKNALPENPWSSASEHIVLMARLFHNETPSGPRFFPSNNMAVPADVFRDLGGFDEEYRFASEDRDLCDRWRHAGLPLKEVPNARISHDHPLDAASFFSQHFAYGQGARLYHHKRQQRGSGRLKSDLSFYMKLPRLFFRVIPRGGRSRSIVPLLMWQIANISGFLYALAGLRRTGRSPGIAGEHPSR